jgi:hypothetical protein
MRVEIRGHGMLAQPAVDGVPGRDAARTRAHDLNDVPRLRLVDLGRMRITANVRLGGGPLGALAWLEPERMLALEEVDGERQRLLAIDLPTGRVAASRLLDGSVQQLGRTAQELIMLIAPARAIGTARLAVADTSGAVRFVRLARIVAGSKLLGTGGNHNATRGRRDLRSTLRAAEPSWWARPWRLKST